MLLRYGLVDVGVRWVRHGPAISREVAYMIALKSRGRRARVWTAAAMVGAASLVLVSCSSDSSDESASAESESSSSDAETDTSSEPTELTKVTYVMPWVTQGEEAGQYAALRNGYFEEEGLDVEIVPGGPDIRAGALLASDSAQFATMNPAAIYTNRAEGIPVVGVGVMNQGDGLLLVCKTSTGITGWQDTCR